MCLLAVLCVALSTFSCKSSQTKSNYKSIETNKIICFGTKTFLSNRDAFFKVLDSVGTNMLEADRRFQLQNFIAGEIEGAKKVKTYHKYQDSLIISYKTEEDKMIGDYTVINRNSGTYSKLAKKDSTTFYIKNKPYSFRKEYGVEIKEYRNIKKEIHDFPCFKVVVKVLINTSEVKEYIIYNLFVTEKLSSLYHPVFKVKSVLEKYYPLDIEETQSNIKGIETRYKLVYIK